MLNFLDSGLLAEFDPRVAAGQWRPEVPNALQEGSIAP
jgi:hypothetical protein